MPLVYITQFHHQSNVIYINPYHNISLPQVKSCLPIISITTPMGRKSPPPTHKKVSRNNPFLDTQLSFILFSSGIF